LDGLEQDLRSLRADLDQLQSSSSALGEEITPGRARIDDTWAQLEAITRRMHHAEKPIPGILRGHERRRDR
jgi:hypothetical protein